MQVGFDADRDGHFIAEGFAEHGRAVDAEVSFVEDSSGFPAGELCALHARAETKEFSLQHDFLGYSLNGEVAGNVEAVLTGFLPGLAFESGGREFGGVKKVGAIEVAVAFFVGGIDTGNLDRRFDGGFFQVGAVNHDVAGELGKGAWHFAHEVADVESDGGVNRVDFVGFDGGGGGLDKGGRKSRRGEEQTGGCFHSK